MGVLMKSHMGKIDGKLAQKILKGML